MEHLHKINQEHFVSMVPLNGIACRSTKKIACQHINIVNMKYEHDSVHQKTYSIDTNGLTNTVFNTLLREKRSCSERRLLLSWVKLLVFKLAVLNRRLKQLHFIFKLVDIEVLKMLQNVRILTFVSLIIWYGSIAHWSISIAPLISQIDFILRRVFRAKSKYCSICCVKNLKRILFFRTFHSS